MSKDDLISRLTKQVEELLVLSTNQYIQIEQQSQQIAALRLENAQQREQMQAVIDAQASEISYLKARVTYLENMLKLNSSNSSKPPASDMHKPKQTRSLREKSGKKPGGQPFHKGDTLSFSPIPDVIESYTPECCWHCGHDFSDVAAIRYERRQVYDIPEIRMQVTEYQSAVKCCPHCQNYSKAVFPAGVSQPAQYGPHTRALAVYLTQYQLLPFERTAELFEDLFSHRLSGSFLVKNNHDCAVKLEPFIVQLSSVLSKREVLHADETGFRIKGERRWLHVLCTALHTYYRPHSKRGAQAMHDMGILADFKGILMHDFWKPYFQFLCDHVLCNSHLLRELKFSSEAEKSEWATQTTNYLKELYIRVQDLKNCGQKAMDEQEIIQWLARYDQLMIYGLQQHPPPVKTAIKQGVVKKSKTQNLLQRFTGFRDNILHFARDFHVPFSNNLAEQAVRMMKVKQKISGCFRSEQGAEDFANTRSYIATMKKQQQNVMLAIVAAVNGKPFSNQV